MKLSTIVALAAVASTSVAAPTASDGDVQVRAPEPEVPTRSRIRRGYWEGDNYIGFAIDEGLNCRECPFVNCTSVYKFDYQAPIVITCQTEGGSVTGDTVWAYTTKGCYVADARIKTRMIWIEGLPKCNATSSASADTPAAT